MPSLGDNPLMLLIFALGAGMLTLGLLQLYKDLRRRENRRIAERLGGYGVSGKPAHLIRDVDAAQKSVVGRVLNSYDVGRAFRRFLTQADVPWPAHQVLSGIFLLCCLVVIVCLVLRIQRIVFLPPLVIAALAAFVGSIPIMVLAVKRSLRLNRFTNQLPEVFDLIGQALRAGHSLITGIQLVGEQMKDPIGKEFQRVYQEQNFGVRLEDALNHLYERVGLLDVRMFCTAVLIQRQTGGDLAEVLDKSGAVIRARIKLAGQVRALTAEGRMSGAVLTVLPIFVFFMCYRINPGYMKELIWGDAQFLLKWGAMLHILGILWIRKIIQIKY